MRQINLDLKRYINTNAKNLKPRGILVARMIVESKAVYIIEIQRRARNIESESGKVQNTEEPYTGFIFTADNQSDVDETIQYFMNRVCSVRGIVKNLLSDCPSKAYAFQHKTAAFETVSCESAVLNALSKIGVVL